VDKSLKLLEVCRPQGEILGSYLLSGIFKPFLPLPRLSESGKQPRLGVWPWPSLNLSSSQGYSLNYIYVTELLIQRVFRAPNKYWVAFDDVSNWQFFKGKSTPDLQRSLNNNASIPSSSEESGLHLIAIFNNYHLEPNVSLNKSQH
jgi:hypothetical protein